MNNLLVYLYNNINNKRPLTLKSMPPTGDEHAKLHDALKPHFMAFLGVTWTVGDVPVALCSRDAVLG